MQTLTNAPRSTADVIRTQLVSTQSVATSATVNPAIKAKEPTVKVRPNIFGETSFISLQFRPLDDIADKRFYLLRHVAVRVLSVCYVRAD